MRTVFITGASSGIGRETTKYFAAQGWRVIATMRNLKKIAANQRKYLLAGNAEFPEATEAT